MLDPLADKILVGTLAAGTAYAGILSPWFLGVTGAVCIQCPPRHAGDVSGPTRAQWDATSCSWAVAFGSAPRRGRKARERVPLPSLLPAPEHGPTRHPSARRRAGKDFFDSSDAFEVRPTQLSKANTAGQLGVLALALVEGAWGVVGAEPLGILQCVARTRAWRPSCPRLTPPRARRAVVATSTILSGAQYVAAYRKYMVLPPKSTFKSKHGGRRRKEE